MSFIFNKQENKNYKNIKHYSICVRFDIKLKESIVKNDKR